MAQLAISGFSAIRPSGQRCDRFEWYVRNRALFGLRTVSSKHRPMSAYALSMRCCELSRSAPRILRQNLEGHVCVGLEVSEFESGLSIPDSFPHR